MTSFKFNRDPLTLAIGTRFKNLRFAFKKYFYLAEFDIISS